jgi:two-component system CheB/CheR fusion protein
MVAKKKTLKKKKSKKPPTPTTTKRTAKKTAKPPKKVVSKAKPKKVKTAEPKSAKKSLKATAKTDSVFPIVGIGASAGGLEALEGFISNIPSNCNIAFVIIQHLAPKHKSIMDSLLRKYTDMKILPVKDGMKVEPNCIYLKTPDKDVSIINRRLYLMDPTKAHAVNLPIDHFFRSLAEDQAEKAICIILSGTGTDGTLGLKAIKGGGGMTMVQTGSQAKYDSMPQSAINTGMVDYVLPVEKMPKELFKYAKHPYIEGDKKKTTPKQKYLDSVNKIFLLIRSDTGHDFSNYKQNTIRRRIERRMAVHQINKIEQYVQYLQEKPAEVEALYKDMLITVTNFFRDPEAFDILEKKVITQIVENKAADYPVRIWIPGCSTGEEAYSIAILLVEAMSRLKKLTDVHIFATDMDEDSLEYARNGVYPEAIAADVSSARLKRFFTKKDSSYKIKKQIREMLIFAKHNLIKDPPFSKLDMISCRNLLIYMDSVLQEKILPLFHYTLKPNGIMFLGSSESIGKFSNLFMPVDTKWRIFICKKVALGKGIDPPILPFYESGKEIASPDRKAVLQESNIRYLAEKMILENYAPSCVLIDEKYEIVYFHGQTDRYLSLPMGEPSFNILKMVREELRYKLSISLRDVVKQKKKIINKWLQVKHNGNFYTVDMTVRPFTESRASSGLIMVIFEESSSVQKVPGRKKMAPEVSAKVESDPRIKALEQELASTKEYLQTAIEEFDTTNEELKSTNEELQSTNEELQSTNEELETSREELQSTNEELETVNSELQGKIDELLRANDDLNNLLGSTEIGTIFLDTNLNIRRFTSSVTEIFNLIKTDVGRPVSDITAKITCDDLCEDAKEVLRTLNSKRSEIQTSDGKWFSTQILPYRTVENTINGVVITFADITERKKIEIENEYYKRSQIRRLATVINDSNDAITVQELDGRITAWNKGAVNMYGYTEAEALKMNIVDIVPDNKKKETDKLIKRIKKGEIIKSLKTERISKDGKKIQVWLTLTSLRDEDKNIVAVATTERDLDLLNNLMGKPAKQ